MVSNDWAQLGVWECRNKHPFCHIKGAVSIPYSAGAKYRLRTMVKGKRVTCELPDHGKSVSIKDSSLSVGGVGLSTFYTSATFHYLKVWSP